MRHNNRSVCNESDQDRNAQPLEKKLRPWTEWSRFFSHDHRTSGPLGKGPATRPSCDGTAICGQTFRRPHRAHDKRGDEHYEQNDRRSNVEIFEKLAGGIVRHHRLRAMRCCSRTHGQFLHTVPRIQIVIFVSMTRREPHVFWGGSAQGGRYGNSGARNRKGQ